jgi:hypothetical protein
VVDVTVTIPGSVSALSSNDRFTWTLAAAPAISGLSTTSGTTAGGIPVTITGTGFTGASAVSFGSVAATFTVNSDTSISTTVPPRSATGTVHVRVTTPSGLSALVSADQFTYSAAAAPTLTSLSLTSGSLLGGSVVNLTGTGFMGATAVAFGSVNTSFEIQSDTWITADVPVQSISSVGVTVTTTGGTSNAVSFSYTGVPGPAISSLTATSGSIVGGDTVIILGSGFSGTSGVTFGSEPADFSILSDNAIQTTTPESPAGAVTVTVTTLSGSATSSFTFSTPATPTVTGRTPTSGGSGGGTAVVVTGTGFATTVGVSFGSVATTAFVVNSDTQLTVLSPPATAVATVDITVTTAGASSNSVADQFTYQAAATPAVTGISPANGLIGGGNTVIVQGTALLGATGVTFDNLPATTFTVLSDSYILAVAPAHSSGSGHVRVTTIINTSTATSADLYTWLGGDGPGIPGGGKPGPQPGKSNRLTADSALVTHLLSGANRSSAAELTSLEVPRASRASGMRTSQELPGSDGDSSGTILVPGSSAVGIGSSPDALTNASGRLFSQGSDNAQGSPGWDSDGASSAAALLEDLEPASTRSTADTLTNVPGTVSLPPTDSEQGSNGTGGGRAVTSGLGESAFRVVGNVIDDLFRELDDGAYSFQGQVRDA